ncbi:large-conductance mechanosensitive channel protein MscL [Oleiagrimonas sp.]|jgi:large conductance mechanosensitive channel|uniref:large-conductance mechanosensitive channel protein MscL n=1 Tax=Oleiagrimonas sp. TaxID=2010330 RepID=UPI0026072259|nr:large-conductance mechanosensitive channel protein MscL [Oleiagrimonas sp.]MDA3914716.1 large-conductance mechanosensitive channel protein MscL [Oleiagrimonas sp.]
MSMLSEFKEFAVKGNMVDMAVGIVIGSAFGTIIKSLVSDMIMPPIGLLTGGVNFSRLKWVLQAAGADGKGEVAIRYGSFIDSVVSFLIIALCIFMVIRAMNRLQRKKESIPEAPAAPPAEVQLLTEIRDLLKQD